jgi:pimeloyl-ACP methyl ester carboxylesterase
MKLALLIGLALLVGACLWLYTPDKSRAALQAKYDTGADEYLDVAGIKLHVRDEGPRAAQPVILLHGFGASLQTWDAWAALLSPQYRVIRFDLPGFGLTGPDPIGNYSDARSMQVLAALMDRLGVQRADLVGNSLGGKIAWSFAAAYPDRVAKLVLVSPDGFASPGFAYGKPAEVPATLSILPYVLPRPLVRMSLAPAYGDPKHLTPATVTRYRDMMLAPGVRAAMLARMRQVMLVNPEPQLRQIHAPTLLLWGERDGMIPFVNAADYLRDLPNAKLVALPGLGHVPFEEAPAASIKPVLAFLAGGPPTTNEPGTNQPTTNQPGTKY